MLTWNCFIKWPDPIIALILHYPVLNLVHTTSDTKSTHMNYLGVIQRCIEVICTPLPLSVCVTASIVSLFAFFKFYFTFIVYCVIWQLFACTLDTCYIKRSINHSTSPSINRDIWMYNGTNSSCFFCFKLIRRHTYNVNHCVVLNIKYICYII